MSEDKPVKLILTGKLRYDDELTMAQAAQILAFLTSEDATAASLQGSGSSLGAGKSTPNLNARQALDAAGAKTNAEKIVAFALIGMSDTKDTFTIEDVKPLFRKARETVPKNFPRDIDTAIRAGWVAEADGPGEYFVTDKAVNVLTTSFEVIRGPRGGKRASGSSSKKPRKSNGGEVPEAFKALDEIDGELDGAIAFQKLSKKTDMFVWALMKGKELGLHGMVGKEISWLTDHLHNGISTGDMAGNYRSAHKNGYANKSLQDQRMRVTPKGEDYLRGLASE